MDAVLDGEATPAEARELDRLLAADPAARTEFEQLKRVFEGLRDIPQAFPPEGLVASVLANIPQNASTRPRPDQLSSRSRVIGSATKEARGTSPGKSVKGMPVYQPAPHSREWNMNEQSSGSRRRNVWIGSGIAMAAALIALAYTIDFPPGAQNVVGTIVPAQRFKAAQPAMDDIKAGGQAATQAVPLQAGSAANAATNNAVNAGTTVNAINASSTNNAINASTNNAVTAGTTNAINAASTNAINAASTNAVTNASTNAVSNASMNAVSNSATNAVGNASMNAATNASMNAVSNATTNAVSAGTTNAVNNASQNAVANSVTNATNNAVANGVSNATNNVINQSTNNAAVK
jgi:anti-sigma factor RsiW